MHLETEARAHAPASLPLQFVHIEVTPVAGGRFAVAMQATLLDEAQLEFVGEDLGNQHVGTIEELLAVIRRGVAGMAAVQ